jgi:hypothetical protein
MSHSPKTKTNAAKRRGQSFAASQAMHRIMSTVASSRSHSKARCSFDMRASGKIARRSPGQ